MDKCVNYNENLYGSFEEEESLQIGVFRDNDNGTKSWRVGGMWIDGGEGEWAFPALKFLLLVFLKEAG